MTGRRRSPKTRHFLLRVWDVQVPRGGACNDLLSPGGGPDLQRTPGGPCCSCRLSHFLLSLALNEISGEMAELLLCAYARAAGTGCKGGRKCEDGLRVSDCVCAYVSACMCAYTRSVGNAAEIIRLEVSRLI